MRITRIAAAITVAASLTGCAVDYTKINPIIDAASIGNKSYATDLAECQRYAAGIDPGASAAGGAVIGAILGADSGPLSGLQAETLALAHKSALSADSVWERPKAMVQQPASPTPSSPGASKGAATEYSHTEENGVTQRVAGEPHASAIRSYRHHEEPPYGRQ